MKTVKSFLVAVVVFLLTTGSCFSESVVLNNNKPQEAKPDDNIYLRAINKKGVSIGVSSSIDDCLKSAGVGGHCESVFVLPEPVKKVTQLKK